MKLAGARPPSHLDATREAVLTGGAGRRVGDTARRTFSTIGTGTFLGRPWASPGATGA